MEKCRSLNQAPRRLDFSGKTSGRPILRVAESFKLLNPSELPQTPLPSRTRLKKTIAFPVENGTRYKRQRRFHARMARCCLEPGRVTCKKAMCWAGLKVLTFAGTFFTTGKSNVGQPARAVTPSTRWPLGKAMVVVAFHFSPVSWRYLGTAAVYKPANLTREIGQECSKCFSASPRQRNVFHQRRTSWEQ